MKTALLKKMFKVITSISLIIWALFTFQTAFGQQLVSNQNSDSININSNLGKVDPFGRSNPRSTTTGLFKSLANEDYLKAYKYFDFNAIEGLQNDSLKIELIKKIEIVLNERGTISPVSIISNVTDGDTSDGFGSSYENIGELNLQNNSMPFLLQLVNTQEYSNIWIVSNETTRQIVQYVNENNDKLSNQIASQGYFSTRWKGAAVKDWIVIVLTALASYFIAWLLTLLISWIVRSLWRNYHASKYQRFLRTLLIPLRLIIAVALLVNMARLFGLAIVVRQAFSVVNLIAVWTAVFIFIWLLIDTLSSFGEDRFRANNSFGALSAISFFKNSAKFILVITAILIVFHTLGFNITGAFAALGVGGIALALGAQKTIENIVGGLSVVFDQPVSVGDFCKFGDTSGTVEKIGMRSTRIRTSARTVVTIPNSDFSTRSIENFSKRDLFLFQTELGLRYETSSDQMRYILVELRKILYAHPRVDPNPARVRFLGYGPNALTVEIYAYFKAKDWNDYLGIQEDINLRIAEVIENSGSGFAFPSQTLYLSKDAGLSNSKKEEAEKKVQKWAENNDLQIPEFDEKTISSLKDSLEYPMNPVNEK